MKTSTTLGVIVLVLGIVVINYGYLHDLVWQGADMIVMGLRSYIVVLAGVIASLLGLTIVLKSH